jgi:hypothetical protein
MCSPLTDTIWYQIARGQFVVKEMEGQVRGDGLGDCSAVVVEGWRCTGPCGRHIHMCMHGRHRWHPGCCQIAATLQHDFKADCGKAGSS